MTTVDVVFRYGMVPTEPAALALSKLREVYGIRLVQLHEKEKTVRVEYDSSRLNQQVIHQLLRRAGLDVTEQVVLYTIPPPPEPAATIA